MTPMEGTRPSGRMYYDTLTFEVDTNTMTGEGCMIICSAGFASIYYIAVQSHMGRYKNFETKSI